jgi:hypothetical protein
MIAPKSGFELYQSAGSRIAAKHELGGKFKAVLGLQGI